MSVSVALRETKISAINHIFGLTGEIPFCAVEYHEVKSRQAKTGSNFISLSCLLNGNVLKG